MAMNFPNSPTVGQTYEPITGVIYTWDGTVWALESGVEEDEVVGGVITIGSTAPESPAVNDVWIDTT